MLGMVFNPTEFDPKSPRDAQPIEQARKYQAGLTDLDTLGGRNCGDKRVRSAWTGADSMDRPQRRRAKASETFFEVHFPRATLILDFYHAAGHLSDLAKAWSDETMTAASLLDAWRHPDENRRRRVTVLRTLEACWDQRRGVGALSSWRSIAW